MYSYVVCPDVVYKLKTPNSFLPIPILQPILTNSTNLEPFVMLIACLLSIKPHESWCLIAGAEMRCHE